jgi:hypothetical protein
MRHVTDQPREGADDARDASTTPDAARETPARPATPGDGPAQAGAARPAPQPDDEARTTVSAGEVRVRRTPKYARFMVLGGAIGVLAALIGATLDFGEPEAGEAQAGAAQLFLYFGIYTVPAGLAIGAIVALVFDRVLARRARTLQAEHTAVEAPPAEGELED